MSTLTMIKAQLDKEAAEKQRQKPLLKKQKRKPLPLLKNDRIN